MPQGISAHGTIIEVQETPGGAFTEIAEIGDITMPGLNRNEFDITSHNRDIDTYILGVLRRDDVEFPMFFNKVIASQLILRTLLIANTLTGFRITAPDGDVWVFSGFVKGMQQSNPVDGTQTANVSIRPSAEFILNGVQYGT